MAITFVEHLFKDRKQDFRRHVDGSLDTQFKGYDEVIFVVDFIEIQSDIAQGQVWFPPLDRSVHDILGLCAYTNNLKMGLVLEFDAGNKRLGSRAYFEKEGDPYQQIGSFILACDLCFRPLSLEVNNRGYWSPQLVLGYMTLYPYGKSN